jgi:hypothetical protein
MAPDDEVTRNHRCFDIAELVRLVMRWLEEKAPFRIEGHVYERLQPGLIHFRYSVELF